jgi:hypothetical protein
MLRISSTWLQSSCALIWLQCFVSVRKVFVSVSNAILPVDYGSQLIQMSEAPAHSTMWIFYWKLNTTGGTMNVSICNSLYTYA